MTFMRTALLALFAVISVSCAHIPFSTQDVNDHYKSVVMVVVNKITKNTDGTVTVSIWSGTGYSISASDEGSTILTNKHICSEGSDALYTITDHAGHIRTARFVRNAHSDDLCVLNTNARIEPVKLAPHDAKRGERVIVIGAPHGVMPQFSDGWVSGYQYVDMGKGNGEVHVRAQVINLHIAGGNSGSPVFNENWEVVGIVFAGRDDDNYMNVMIPIENIYRFLDTSQDVRER